MEIPGYIARSDLQWNGHPLHHQIEWTIEPERIAGKITCISSEGDPCRTFCSGGECETLSFGDKDGFCVNGHPIVGDYPCLFVTWLEAEGEPLEVSYAGDSGPLFDGPVRWAWNGDNYLWRYSTAEERAAAPLPVAAGEHRG